MDHSNNTSPDDDEREALTRDVFCMGSELVDSCVPLVAPTPGLPSACSFSEVSSQAVVSIIGLVRSSPVFECEFKYVHFIKPRHIINLYPVP